jgi:hypothetical protein
MSAPVSSLASMSDRFNNNRGNGNGGVGGGGGGGLAFSRRSRCNHALSNL